MTKFQLREFSTVTNENIFDSFDRSFARAGERIAIRSQSGHTKLNFATLRSAAARYANALVALGIEPGDRITVQIDKPVANVILYLASLKVGAVYQPLNTAYTETEVAYFVADAGPKIIVCDPSRQQAMRKLGDRNKVLAVVNLDSNGEGSLASLAARMEDSHETAARNADDLAGLLYTSGTTGRSKGAMITHGNLASNAATLVKLWRITRDDVLLHALPIFHVHGLFVALNTAFLSACEIIWLGKFDVAAVIAALPRATLMMGVPTFYTRLLTAKNFDRETCRNMRLFISGSAPLLAGTHDEFRARTGHCILERYGMTETGMITSNPYEGARLAGTVGFALPDVSVRISGEQPGGLEVKGPNVFKGYWRMPEKTTEDFTDDGYFITGDIARLDAEARVSIVGRAKDVIISGGFNVYPKEIEDAINALPGVVESAVVGVPHRDFGEAIIAAVCTKGPHPAEAQMIADLSKNLARFKLPKRILVIEELPRNAMGKIQKADLRRRYAGIFDQA